MGGVLLGKVFLLCTQLCTQLEESVILGATRAVSWAHTGTCQRPRPTHWGLQSRKLENPGVSGDPTGLLE